MTPDRARDIERICQAALERGPNARAAFLAEACAGDDALRREVESLLAQESGAAGFLSTPAAAVAARLNRGGTSFIGRRLGAYQVLSLIDVGGMGEVYRARDTKLGRDVAIKMLPKMWLADPDRRTRFDREAVLLASLNHPHIGAIYGVEDTDGVRALVLELVEGPTLADRLAKGPMSVSETMAIATQIADALDTAHRRGIIHRDLKPANIKVTPAGAVKVLDFGLAKLAAGEAKATGGATAVTDAPTVTTGGTREGIILGTPAYMSPEQTRGQPVDKRTDIWAFGCVLYEMLSGRPAFAGTTLTDTLAAVINSEPDWRALPDTTPAGVQRLLRRCLQKDARIRLHDIADARIEIDDALRVGPLNGTTQHIGRSQKLAVAAAVITIAAVLGAWGVSQLRRPDSGGPMLRLQINPPEGGEFGRLVNRGQGLALALSPDGKTAVYGATVGGKYSLWLRSLDNTVASPLRGTEEAKWPFWSPDGMSIAFFAGGRLQRIDVADGKAFDICKVPTAYGGAWTADGRIVVGLFGGTLASVSAKGGTLSPLTTFNAPMGDVAHIWPQALPGGHFLYWTGSSKPENSGVVYAASFDKPNDRVRLVASDTLALYVPGGRGGYLLWQRGGALVAQDFDGATLKFSGEPRVIAESVGIIGAAGYMAVAASTSGTLVYGSADLQQLRWFDRTGKELGVVGEPGQYFSISFSPNGKQIATTRIEGGRELWLIDADGGGSRRTTHDSEGGFYPQWSPDGRTILFIGEQTTALYRKDATGIQPDERLASWPASNANFTDWSRDGRWMLNTHNTVETRADIWVVPVTPDGHLATDAQPHPYLRTPVNELAGRFSPEMNPRWVSYQSDESGHNEVYVQSFPQPRGSRQISANGGAVPQWAPDGREIFYQRPDGKIEAVTLKFGADSLEASAPRELFGLPPRSTFGVAPDGRFLVALPNRTPHPLTVIVNWPALLKQPATR